MGCFNIYVHPYLSYRSRHWAGAKAIAKLIKPKKENSREKVVGPRERIRSAPDIPLPEIPTCDFPECATLPPPLPPRQTRLSVESMNSNSTEENHARSPTLSPAQNGRGEFCCNRAKISFLFTSSNIET